MSYFEDLITSTGLTIIQYQEKYKEEIEATLRPELGRDLEPNGAIGNHTIHHILQRRCGTPEHATVEEARIPPTCQLDYRLWINWNNYRPRDMSLSLEKAKEAFAKALYDWWKAIGLKFTEVQSAGEAHCTIDFERLRGSTLAWSHLADNTCNPGQRQRYDIRGWSFHLFYLVALHELGHLLGLEHIPGNFIMNPSIITSLSGLTQRDIQTAINLGYPGPPDDNDEDPPPNGWSVTGSLDIHTPQGTKKVQIVGV